MRFVPSNSATLEKMSYPAFRDPGLRWAALLLALPFFLQLGGLGGGLGGGLCGELFANKDTPLVQQSSGFWYGLLFMFWLAFQLAYGGLLLLASLIEMPGEYEPALYGFGSWLIGLLGLLFVLTRSTGLPHPSAVGFVWGDPAPADVLSLVLVGLSVVGGVLLVLLKRKQPAKEGRTL